MYYTEEYYATEYYLRSLRPNKGKNMNEINDTTDTEAPFMVEILDNEGNPTGQYRKSDSETTSSEAEVLYTTAEDGDHAVVSV